MLNRTCHLHKLWNSKCTKDAYNTLKKYQLRIQKQEKI